MITITHKTHARPASLPSGLHFTGGGPQEAEAYLKRMHKDRPAATIHTYTQKPRGHIVIITMEETPPPAAPSILVDEPLSHSDSPAKIDSDRPAQNQDAPAPAAKTPPVKSGSLSSLIQNLTFDF